MIILLAIILSLMAGFLGALVGSWFWTFSLGFRWLRQVLVDEAALTAFWIFTFKSHGGIGERLRHEELPTGKEATLLAPVVIKAEVDSLSALQRYCAAGAVILLVVSGVVAAFTSVAVFICAAAGFLTSIRLRNRGIAMNALATMFRAVYIWMRTNRKSLDDTGGVWMRGIVRVLDENEPIEQPGCSTAAA